jgi:hypothetical protein
MNSNQAETWVTVGAVATAGIYGYRRIVDPSTTPAGKGNAKALAGADPAPVPTGQFVTAWGATWLIVSIMAEADPGLGGAFALLILAADFLANANVLFTDVTTAETSSAGVKTKGTGTTAKPAGKTSTGPVNVTTGTGNSIDAPAPELPGNFNLEPVS